jgi:mycoredoxin-dependent peroxiredoxin
VTASPGSSAPAFTGVDDEGNRVELADLAGRPVVLHFFALAWTGVCASELARLVEITPELEGLGAQVLGVSCDSRFTLAAWKKAMSYDLRLVSDFWPHGEIGRRFGVLDTELGIDRRCTFVIDRGGVVRSVIAAPDLARGRDVASYLDAVRRL